MKIILENGDGIMIKVTKLNPEEIEYHTGQDTDNYKISARLPDGLMLDHENKKWTFSRMRNIGIPVSLNWDDEDFLSYFASKRGFTIDKFSNGTYFYQLFDKDSDEPIVYHSEIDLTKDIFKHMREQEKNRNF